MGLSRTNVFLPSAGACAVCGCLVRMRKVWRSCCCTTSRCGCRPQLQKHTRVQGEVNCPPGAAAAAAAPRTCCCSASRVLGSAAYIHLALVPQHRGCLLCTGCHSYNVTDPARWTYVTMLAHPRMSQAVHSWRGWPIAGALQLEKPCSQPLRQHTQPLSVTLVAICVRLRLRFLCMQVMEQALKKYMPRVNA